MKTKNVLLGLTFIGMASTSGIAAAASYCNQDSDPIVGQYLSAVSVQDGLIPTQMMINPGGGGLYDDSTHHGHKVQWDPRVDGPKGILSSDGYMQWKKISGMNYKVYLTFLLGYPTELGDAGVFPLKDFKRYVAVGTATRSKDCSTLTVTFCSFVLPPETVDIDPNTLSCEGQEVLVFNKIPNL